MSVLDVKPILVVRLPHDMQEYEVHLTRKALFTNDSLTKEYHIIVIVERELKTVKFEIYNSPHDENKIREIDALVKVSVERCYRYEEERLKRKNKFNG